MATLGRYRLLGRSGLRVSPLALGTMTFGAAWGADAETAKRIFDKYVDNGGNFIDTANDYAAGHSETLVGEFAAGRRDHLVLATKYSMPLRQGDPNAAGNHRKSMMQSVEQSLSRLRTDYIDILYLHAWDFTTPVEEILRGLDDLVRHGKILYAAISDAPAWQVSRMQAIAELRGWAPLIGLQIEYSLAQRSSERDLIPMAAEMGLGVLPWSPLGMGVLAGKYRNHAEAAEQPGRGPLVAQSGRITDKTVEIADAIRGVAIEMGRSPAQIALAWTLLNPVVTAPIIGVRTLEQLEENLGSLGVVFSPEQVALLDQVSRIDLGFPHEFLAADRIRLMLRAGTILEERINQSQRPKRG
jgi:aryl-alcohol dehydrogenase-like predicted oxidoreductase